LQKPCVSRPGLKRLPKQVKKPSHVPKLPSIKQQPVLFSSIENPQMKEKGQFLKMQGRWRIMESINARFNGVLCTIMRRLEPAYNLKTILISTGKKKKVPGIFLPLKKCV
jgi:hypothetical protein